MSDTVRAPFTPEQVACLTEYQNSAYYHPFTCPAGHGRLAVTVDGWICGGCDYEQDWCWEFMARYEPRGRDLVGNPVRSCCGQRHRGVQCPDGLVMCCLCFERVLASELSERDGQLEDVCRDCAEAEWAEVQRRGEQEGSGGVDG